MSDSAEDGDRTRNNGEHSEEGHSGGNAQSERDPSPSNEETVAGCILGTPTKDGGWCIIGRRPHSS